MTPKSDIFKIQNTAACQSVACNQRCEFQGCFLKCDNPECHFESHHSTLFFQLTKTVKNVTVQCNGEYIEFPALQSERSYMACGWRRIKVEVLSHDVFGSHDYVVMVNSIEVMKNSGTTATNFLFYFVCFYCVS